MITGAQMRAARALLGIDQRELAQRSGLSLPTIQRMEASDGVVRGNVDSLMKLVEALAAAGIELISEGAASHSGGRGGRLQAWERGEPARWTSRPPPGGDDGARRAYSLCGTPGDCACCDHHRPLRARAHRCLWRKPPCLAHAPPDRTDLAVRTALGCNAAARTALARRPLSARCAGGLLPGCGQPRRCSRKPLCDRIWRTRHRAAAPAARLSTPS